MELDAMTDKQAVDYATEHNLILREHSFPDEWRFYEKHNNPSGRCFAWAKRIWG